MDLEVCFNFSIKFQLNKKKEMTLQLDTYTVFNSKLGNRALQKQKYKIMGLLLCVHALFLGYISN